MSRLAASNGTSPSASARIASAACASGVSESGSPSETLNGSARAPAPGRACAGLIVRANTRTTSRRRVASSGTTTPTRFAPASTFERAHAAAASSSWRADWKMYLPVGGIDGSRSGSPHFDALLGAGIEKLPLLRREDVEGVGDERLRRSERGVAEQRRDHVGQARGVGRIALRVGAAQRANAAASSLPGKAPSAPAMRQPCARRQARRHSAAACAGASSAAPSSRSDRLPQLDLLRFGQQQRQRRRELGIQRVLVQPLDQGGQRQDVGALPDGQALVRLPRVELARELLRQAPVGGDHAELRRVPRGEALEQLLLRQRGVRHEPDDSRRGAQPEATTLFRPASLARYRRSSARCSSGARSSPSRG